MPVHPTKRYGRRSIEGIRYAVWHHSGVDADSSAYAIADYHVKPHGPSREEWPGAGYTAVIRRSGEIELCWPLDVMCYGVAGRNAECLSVCCSGNFMDEPPPPAQRQGLQQFVDWARVQLGRHIPIVGHRDVALSGYETSCPGDSWGAWRHELH